MSVYGMTRVLSRRRSTGVVRDPTPIGILRLKGRRPDVTDTRGSSTGETTDVRCDPVLISSPKKKRKKKIVCTWICNTFKNRSFLLSNGNSPKSWSSSVGPLFWVILIHTFWDIVYFWFSSSLQQKNSMSIHVMSPPLTWNYQSQLSDINLSEITVCLSGNLVTQVVIEHNHFSQS